MKAAVIDGEKQSGVSQSHVLHRGGARALPVAIGGDAIDSGSGAFQHGHTYIGHATACAAALAVQQTVRDGCLLEVVQVRGKELATALAERFDGHPHIGNIRSRGLFRGLKLVADRATRAPFDPTLKLHARVKKEAMARGLCCHPMGKTIDGRQGDHALIAPPFIMTTNQIGELVDKLSGEIDAAIRSVQS
jgi:adenosylmethionine-8-amino-7-oxononanoate aminotransferase